jgi:exosortase
MQPVTASPTLVRHPGPSAGGSAAPAARFYPLRRLRVERWTVTHAVAAALMAALGIAATWAAWQDIYDKAYRETEYSHIFLVPVVALWMVFARRLRLRHCRPIGVALGVAVALFGWSLHTYGYYNNYQTLWHAGAVCVALGCALSVLGKHALFRFFPAVAVLVFLIPVPQYYRLQIAQPLQSWTAEVSHTILSAIGAEVQRAGDKLWVNKREVEIAEACNGLRMVFALFLVSYAFSFGLPLRNGVRFIVLLASPVTAIACNVIRVVPNAYAYGYVSNDAGKMLHDYLGWVMLPVSFLLLLGVIKLLRWAMVPVMKFTLAA